MRLLCAFAAFLTLLACAGPASTDLPPMSGAIQVNEPDHAAWVQAVQDSGLDAIQVTLYARQQTWDSADLMPPADAEAVIHEIRVAKAAGLAVTLVLRVALEQGIADNRHFWHGMIWPADDEVDAWFRNYEGFALWGAEIAESEDVDLLAIGSELNALTSTINLDTIPNLYAYFLDPERTAPIRQRLVDCAATIPPQDLAVDLTFVDGGTYATLEEYLRAQEASDRAWTRRVTGADDSGLVDLASLNRRRGAHEAHWRRIIAGVRETYDGPLSYAANFDQVEDVGFWDALDAVGVNAYYPLSRYGLEGAALEAAMVRGWETVAAQLNTVAERYGGAGRVLPVVLFELGWTRKSGSTVRPFSYHRVEVLETEPGPGRSALTCVHWATQPEDPRERVAAITALDRVVEQGDFPTLRGFMLWKLSTLPAHREIEPFAVITGASDDADADFLRMAARLAARLRGAAEVSR